MTWKLPINYSFMLTSWSGDIAMKFVKEYWIILLGALIAGGIYAARSMTPISASREFIIRYKDKRVELHEGFFRKKRHRKIP